MNRGDMRALLRQRVGDPREKRWTATELDRELNASAVYVGNEVATFQGATLNYPKIEAAGVGDGTSTEYLILRGAGLTNIPPRFIREFLVERTDTDPYFPLTRIQEDEAQAWAQSGRTVEPLVYYIAHRPDAVNAQDDRYVIGFPTAPPTTYTWRLQWMAWSLEIPTGSQYDHSVFNFVPTQHHELVVLRAAHTCLTTDDDAYMSVNGQYAEALSQLRRALHSTVHGLEVQQDAYIGELSPEGPTMLTGPWNPRRDY